jgi:hypothetical protein
LKQLLLDSSACFSTGFFKAGTITKLNDAMKAALVKLRPQMISLVEYKASFDDPYLDISSIGNQYGDIYEN